MLQGLLRQQRRVNAAPDNDRIRVGRSGQSRNLQSILNLVAGHGRNADDGRIFEIGQPSACVHWRPKSLFDLHNHHGSAARPLKREAPAAGG